MPNLLATNQRPFSQKGTSQPDFHSRHTPAPPPPLGSVAVHHLPVLQKFKAQHFCHLLPQHSHNNIAIGPSFSLYNKASWVSCLFFILAAGCYNVHGYQWSNMLHDYHCPRCRQHHPFHPVSCLAFCTALEQHLQAYIPSSPRMLWGPKIPKPATVRNTTFFVKLYHKEHIFRS